MVEGEISGREWGDGKLWRRRREQKKGFLFLQNGSRNCLREKKNRVFNPWNQNDEVCILLFSFDFHRPRFDVGYTHAQAWDFFSISNYFFSK